MSNWVEIVTWQVQTSGSVAWLFVCTYNAHSLHVHRFGADCKPHTMVPRVLYLNDPEDPSLRSTTPDTFRKGRRQAFTNTETLLYSSFLRPSRSRGKTEPFVDTVRSYHPSNIGKTVGNFQLHLSQDERIPTQLTGLGHDRGEDGTLMLKHLLRLLLDS